MGHASQVDLLAHTQGTGDQVVLTAYVLEHSTELVDEPPVPLCVVLGVL